jgi:hypothetical protein
MADFKSGMQAGLFASFTAAGMVLMNNAVHGIAELRPAHTLATILGSDSVMTGWIALLVLGIVVFGALFAALEQRIPIRSALLKGTVFGIASWLLMMTVFMPLGGGGLFGLERGTGAAPAALVLNLVYWVILSVVYRWATGVSAPRKVSA